MKKVLFTTTALVACAGMAAAEVNLSGSGRLGLVNTGSISVLNGVGLVTAGSSTKVEKRMTINIDGSGETDGGLSFGGRIRLRSDEGGSGATGTAASGANIWIGNDTWRVTTGNTSGAMNWRMKYFTGSVGLTGLQWANLSFNIGNSRFGINTFSSTANGQDVVRLDFSAGDFGVSLSVDNTAANISNAGEKAIAANYNFGDWTVAAGYADETAGNDIWSISANGSIGDFGVGLNYSDRKTVGSKAVLSGSYDFGETTVTAFLASTSEDVLGSAGFTATSSSSEYGIGFTHSLGGAVLAGGVSRNYAKQTMADLGVRFDF